MTIDIASLSYDELIELKHMINMRLKHLDSNGGARQSRPFKPGETVSFAHPRQGRLTGTLIKYNQKTVTIVTSTGQQWDVSPNLLRRVRRGPPGVKGKAKIIDISNRQS